MTPVDLDYFSSFPDGIDSIPKLVRAIVEHPQFPLHPVAA